MSWKHVILVAARNCLLSGQFSAGTHCYPTAYMYLVLSHRTHLDPPLSLIWQQHGLVYCIGLVHGALCDMGHLQIDCVMCRASFDQIRE